MIIRFVLFLALIFVSYLYIHYEKPYKKESIVFGASLAKDGMMSSWGKSVIGGVESYFTYANDNELVANRKLSFITYEDRYEPQITLKNTQKLINEDEVFALFGFVGTPTVKNILSLTENQPIPFIAPFTGAEFLRQGSKSNIINIRASYRQEIETIVDYLYYEKKIDKFAVFYQNDEYGYEGYVSLLQSLKEKDLSLVAEGTYKRNSLSINHAYNQIKNSDAQAVVMVGASLSSSYFLQRAKEDDDFNDMIFATVSFSDANAIVQRLNRYDNIIFSQVVPSYDDESLDIVKQYRTIYSNYCDGCEYSFISFEAFIAAKLITETLIKTDPLTKYKFIQTLHKKVEKQNFLNQVYLFYYDNNQFIRIENE